MDINKLNDKMNDYVVNMDFYDEFVYENIEIFYGLNFVVQEILGDDIGNCDDYIDISKISKVSFTQIIDLLKNFYKKLNIKFDVDKLFNNGTIDYLFFDYEDNSNDRFKIGANYNDIINNKMAIIACNNGIISDGIILAHELSHYRNHMEKYRTIVAMFFTETLALTDELIFYDFLLKKEYNIDSNFMKSAFKFFYVNADEVIPIMELLSLYKSLGSISKENFKMFYKTEDDYEENLDYLDKMPMDAALLNTVSYNISLLLAPYLFYKYKKEKSYQFLDEFNILIMNKDIKIEDCFKYLEINPLDANDQKILTKNMNRFKKEYLK